MSDRVSVNLTLHGEVRQGLVEDLLAALKKYDFRDSGTWAQVTAKSLGETMTAEEVNYADISSVTDFCDAHAISYEYNHEAGGGYGAAVVRFDGIDRHEAPYSEGEAMVHYSKVLEVETLVTGMATLIEQAKFWAKPLGELTIV